MVIQIKKNMNRISFFFGKLLNVKNPRIYGIMLLWLFLHYFTPHCVPFLLLCVNSGSVIPACRLQVPIISLQKPGEDNPSTAPLRETPSWRAGLRKTGSTSMVNDSLNENDKNNLPRSASSPRLALNNNNRLENVSYRSYKPSVSW